MTRAPTFSPRRAACVALALLALALPGAGGAAAAEPAGPDAAALRGIGRRLLDGSADNPLHRPLTVSSTAEGGAASAVTEGVIDRPFADLLAALVDPEHWCAVLVLHINNKGCRTSAVDGVPHVVLKVGRRWDQPAEQANDLDFAYQVLASGAGLLSVRLAAPDGPMGTRDHLIRLDAAPLDERHSVLRLVYGYRTGGLTGMAMGAYFATVARDKVGFTVDGKAPDGAPQFIGGPRGLVERNLMRYFFAVEAAASEPESAGGDVFGRRLKRWFDATEQYPRQLHEIDLATYLEAKRPLRPGGP